MRKTPDMIPWLRGVVAVTLVGVLLNLAVDQDANFWVLALGLGVFAVLLPVWGWTARWPMGVSFALAVGQAALVTGGLFVSSHPGTILTLFFVLLPMCARMPRKYSLVCYALFPLLACLPHFLQPQGLREWATVAEIIPGFLAVIVLTESFLIIRRTAEENGKLLDELIEAQKKLPGESLPPAPVNTVFTRRETEVLGLVAKGYTNKEIAQRLFLAEGTVKNRVSAILEKIQVRDRTQAALRARELGIL